MDEFTRAVFDAVYQSHPQRNLRRLLGSLLVLKHMLRGLIFSWPLYLLSLSGLALPGAYAWLFLLILIPAAGVSGYILSRGLREDYVVYVKNRLLKQRDFWPAFLGKEI